MAALAAAALAYMDKALTGLEHLISARAAAVALEAAAATEAAKARTQRLGPLVAAQGFMAAAAVLGGAALLVALALAALSELFGREALAAPPHSHQLMLEHKYGTD